ncbi:HDIG domain-containing protein [Dokdonia sinensis]|uniref:HDIG domain-containing protein n=1 Tax=Dokdonia sinensis TaxID=2479847 RepID=A0A3M0G3G6_9FLAO|nr:HDIG domain-containing metalloprotein [Dokdonia sinensis]RMB59530.1 HDIG domain-containing protein [Dokdonia sinensis]
MKNYLKSFYKHQDLLYKLLLVVASAVLIVYTLPKSGKFQYDIQKGFPWSYNNLYADDDFAILKSESSIEEEKKAVRDNAILYFTYDEEKVNTTVSKVKDEIASISNDSTLKNLGSDKSELEKFTTDLLNTIYEFGVIDQAYSFNEERLIYLQKGNKASQITLSQLRTTAQVSKFLENEIVTSPYAPLKGKLLKVLYENIKTNVSFNSDLTEAAIKDGLSKISPTRGVVAKGSRIVARGEIVEGETLLKLLSLKSQYESQDFSESTYNWILLGYIFLVMLALVMLVLFIKTYRFEVYMNNTKITFIFFNVVLMVLLTTLIVKLKPEYVYVVPLCILPLILKAFFDARLGLFTHVITILLLGFIVPDSFEYFFLQVIAGIVTILTVPELYKRANLFISVGQITLVYIIAYFAFHAIHEGSVDNLKWENFAMFGLAGLGTLFVQPLIYVYERIFGLVSDVSLLELSDTNTKLLKQLADDAPGTFHHSLNVANLCEAAANEIGANAMLVRVGALYHDIGKMTNPTDFTENQATGVNSHEDLSPQESARIIVDHVINGIEIARKNKLPDRVIDFIRTHHGTSTVYYFYMKAKEVDDDVKQEDFSYPGPLPFSKETAILMMADSVEAASKSLKNPTSTLIDAFVEKIVKKQMDEGQFLNANITFKEIQQIKKVLKRKLNNIYHLRIEYPE